MKKILIIDDDRSICKTLQLHLSPDMTVYAEHSGSEGLKTFERVSPHLVILDLRLPDMGGLEVLDRIRAMNESAYVIVVTAFQDMESTVTAVKKGAFDYISKPISLDQLDLSIKKVFQNLELHLRLKDLLDDVYREYKVDTIIGKSRSMEDIFKTIGIASQSRVTVLIQGESGTGKELIARAIHYNSQEKEKPFIAINCSALVETLLESELFGHEKGSFTGAISRKEGKFEVASGGTIFLDEIGEMSQALQVKLLRILQERSFERVGGSETIRTDVRVLAATNKDLQKLTSKGLFREDLYYRLKVITIEVPPLRERKEDIPLLVSHLLEKTNRELHKSVRKVPGRVMEMMMNYSWPGNVRELENVITRGVLLAKGDVILDLYLPGVYEVGAGDSVRAPDWKAASLDDVEREHIQKTLEHTGWNKSKAATLLGITLPRLDRKIKKYYLLNLRAKAALKKSVAT